MNSSHSRTATVALIVSCLAHPSFAAGVSAKDAELAALAFHKAVSNYSAATADETALKSRKFFVDDAAYRDFRNAMQSSGNFEAVKKFQMNVSSLPRAAKAVKADDGAWKVTFTAKDSYRPPVGVGIDRCVVVDVSLKPLGKNLAVSSVVETDCPAK